ncbi:protein of unknown function [Brochothrix thermosphacta]|uniref:Uncharacterized protein n=1 Tax=Brochothrix thermosphacta TaxID=2756 RepID=A0A2X0QFU6_BROTH|nr:protein of unknown function [Brochothrix thermosphacta]SPP27496.1 hypothetical protein BTBSAS_150065 [Brochothrix thermosphacta]
MLCTAIGTGMIPIVIGGINPKIISTAIIIPINAIECVFI